MWRQLRRPCVARFSTAVATRPAALQEADPFKTLALPTTATRDDLRNQFFELCKAHHPALTGDTTKYQTIVDAYEDAIKVVDQKQPVPSWDGISPMTYAQAWQGKDHWRRLWEEHWGTRLAHMYKHHAEMSELAAAVKWREAQYVQVRDWLVLAKDVMDRKTRANWLKACEVAQDGLLWAQVNKSNYRRYFISNQTIAINMQQVYNEHEYWRQYENVHWAEWDRFFAEASAWALEHEGSIRNANPQEGPLATKFEYLFKGKLQFALMNPEDKMAQRSKEEKEYNRLYWRAELMKALRLAMRWGERFARAFFPVLVLAVIYGYYTDFQLMVNWLDISTSDTGAVETHVRNVDLVDWLLAGTPEPSHATKGRVMGWGYHTSQ